MKFEDFERIMSSPRMSRYYDACGGNSRQAMVLYRLNLSLSQELFTIISCFEVALRNAIDSHYTTRWGADWLQHSIVAPQGIFSRSSCHTTAQIIAKNIKRLTTYTHSKLVAEMEFGFWVYLFAQPQYLAGGQNLLHIFPAKPKSTPSIQYNHTYVFNELTKINELRNRIAHHEPICFVPKQPVKNTRYARQNHRLIHDFFNWLQIDAISLLYGLDHVTRITDKIDRL